MEPLPQKPSPMDDPLWDTIKQTMKQDGVQGVLIADKEGLCIVRDGNVPSAAAGIARSIAIRSAEFFPRESNSSPLVVIETEESKVLIRGQDSGIISVVHKSK